MTARTFWRLLIILSCVSVAICLDCQLDWVVSACADDCEDLGPLRSWESTCTDSTLPPNLVEIQPLLLFNYCSQYFPQSGSIACATSTPAKVHNDTFVTGCSNHISHFIVRAHSPFSQPKGHIKILQLARTLLLMGPAHISFAHTELIW